ncbi:hypothetical protein [Ktedonospora formicarum]|uniref:hypothetical protein n=1 Tax=Ktedonospora formicarum TaxID=2778364 RepID=UPI001C68A28A|nr:hypothetical protein [Ktedonospora formicarum]
MEQSKADGGDVSIFAPARAYIGAQLEGLEDHVMVRARESGGRDALQEEGDDLGREGLGHRLRDGLLLLVLACHGLEEGMHGGVKVRLGTKKTSHQPAA